jgi:hypothetical protein
MRGKVFPRPPGDGLEEDDDVEEERVVLHIVQVVL